jgi:hypothetical protein
MIRLTVITQDICQHASVSPHSRDVPELWGSESLAYEICTHDKSLGGKLTQP